MSRESAKAKYTRLSGDPEVGYISPDDVMDAIDIMYDDMTNHPVVDADVAADADIARSKIAGTAVVTAQIAGATKTDGQNVTNLRRPTLAVEKVFPNARHDHQIVWVDETAKIAYAIGQDNRLRKSTWTYAADEALTFGTYKSEAATTERWCDNGVFLRIPTTGELLMEQVTKASGQTVLLRSTDDGATWTTVWTAPAATVRFLGPQSVVRDGSTGYLYLCEYTTDTGRATVSIWRSTDKGATWTEWKTTTRAESGAGTIRHWHSGRYDPVSQRVFFMAGDTNPDAGIYRVNGAGDNIEAVVLNSRTTVLFPDYPTSARAVDVMFFPDYLAWACDGGGGQPHVMRMARDQIGAANPVVEKVAAIDNTGWWAIPASTDGSVWICSTSTETGVSWQPDAGIVHLYAVSDNGSLVDEVAQMAMDGNLVGTASLSGMCGPSGASGSAFWLRAHTYQAFPYQTFSGLQMRCRLGYGVTQIQNPANRPRAGYNRQTQNTRQEMAAGATVTWGHYRVPRRCTAMYVFDYGAKALAGSGGYTNKAKLEVWNATTSTKLFEWFGQSIRYDGRADTDEFVTGPFVCAAGDEIEFRLTNLDASNALTGSCFITFGFGF